MFTDSVSHIKGWVDNNSNFSPSDIVKKST